MLFPSASIKNMLFKLKKEFTEVVFIQSLHVENLKKLKEK